MATNKTTKHYSHSVALRTQENSNIKCNKLFLRGLRWQSKYIIYKICNKTWNIYLSAKLNTTQITKNRHHKQQRESSLLCVLLQMSLHVHHRVDTIVSSRRQFYISWRVMSLDTIPRALSSLALIKFITLCNSHSENCRNTHTSSFLSNKKLKKKASQSHKYNNKTFPGKAAKSW